MFKKVMSNYAANDEGVEVRGVSRDLFEYREGLRVLRIGREGATAEDGSPAQIVYLDSFLRWEPPYENEQITIADADRICANVVDAYAALGTPTFIERRGL
jgi:hypothetical protein